MTVYPDADAAAIKWQNINTAKPYPLSLVNDAVETYHNKELDINYRAGYLYGTLLCVRAWLKATTTEG